MNDWLHYFTGFCWGTVLAGVVYTYLLKRHRKQLNALMHHQEAMLEFLKAIAEHDAKDVTIVIDKRHKKGSEGDLKGEPGGRP